MKVNGRWLSIDPRSGRMATHDGQVGLGTADKARELVNLQLMIGVAQEKLLPLDWCSRRTCTTRPRCWPAAMGYRKSDDFFSPKKAGEPAAPAAAYRATGGADAPAGPALAQLKGQVDVHVAQMTQQAQDAQAQRETELVAARDRQKMQNEKELEAFQAQQQAQLEQFKAQLQAETSITIARINAEARSHPPRRWAKDASNAREDVAYQRRSE